MQLSSKLRSQRGESITEVLVATAIGGLALLMLAMAISVAVHMATTSRSSLDEYYTANNAIAEAKATSLGIGEVALAPPSGDEISLAGDDLQVRYYRFDSDKAGLDSVIAYEEDSEAGGA
ncbi:MAG: hypothetical protein IJ111_01950 [Eggerthellaceae bacterium]|nr:hypothetical protein [Eggerthellaceae bacterium]